MRPEQPTCIPNVKIVAKSKGEAERLIMFESAALDPDSTYQAVVDESVSDIPSGAKDVILWVVENNRGEWDGTLKLRVVGIQLPE